MKGSELLGEIIALFILIGISFVAVGIVLWVMNLTEETDWGSTYALTLNPIHQPIKYEIMLLSYIETTQPSGSSGPMTPVKRIIFNAVEQETTDINNVDVGGQTFDLQTISKPIFDGWFRKDPYLLMLKIGEEEYPLAGTSKSFVGIEDKKIPVKKVAVPIKTPSNEGMLILYVEG